MKSFKQFLINEALERQSVHTEAVLVLRKIVDMVDNGHVDYSDSRIAINVGRLIHDKKYNNLDIIILKSDKTGMQIGRHSKEERHAIFMHTTKLPARNAIDEYLLEKERSSSFKTVFAKFLNDADIDSTNDHDGTKVEQTNKLNTREEFEQLYNQIVSQLDTVFKQYLEAKRDIYKRIEKSSNDMGEREILKSSALRLRNDMLGANADDFKRKALGIIGDKFKLLNKEFKAKLESRLESFYENKVK